MMPTGRVGRSTRVVAFAALSVVCAAGPLLAAEPTVSRHVMANGMRVLVREDRSANVVAIALHVDAGSRLETETTAGITNFVHRVMIRGAAGRSASLIAEAAEELGGTIDASADVDQAEIRGRALGRHWESLLSLIGDVALAPTFPPTEIERERRLILAQIQSRDEAPFRLALDTLMADLYGPHPYGLPPVGHRSTVERISRDELLARYRAMYVARRLVLAISGDVARDKVVKIVERRFGKLVPGPSRDANPLPAPLATRSRRVIEKSAHQAQVLVGYLGPRLSDPDYATVKVLSALLGGGIAGRLFAELRERRGLAYSIGALNPSRMGASPFIAYLGTTPGNVDAAETAMRREIERLRTEPASADEIERAKAYLLGTLAMDRRTNARQAWYLGFYETVGAGWDFPDRYARAVTAVSAHDVTTAAARYLDSPSIVVLLPPG
jgi:zinc protease